jgi:hypothetical protein
MQIWSTLIINLKRQTGINVHEQLEAFRIAKLYVTYTDMRVNSNIRDSYTLKKDKCLFTVYLNCSPLLRSWQAGGIQDPDLNRVSNVMSYLCS